MIEDGRVNEAEAIADLDSDDYSVPDWMYTELGDAYAEQGQTEDAIDSYKRALQRNPGRNLAREKLTEKGVDVAALVPTVNVSPEVLAAYLGTFVFDDDTSITFTFDDGVFYGTPDWGGARTTLYALSETEFFFDNVDVQVTFDSVDSGNVDSISLDFFGDPFIGKRVE